MAANEVYEVQSGVLTKNGEVFKQGSKIELTADQAERLGGKVAKYEAPQSAEDFVENGEYEEAAFRKLGAPEQKKVVEAKGGNLEEITNEDARWEFVSKQ